MGFTEARQNAVSRVKGLSGSAWERVRVVSAWVGAKKDARLLLLQCVGAFSFLFGLSWYSVPVALMVGGLGAILVAERQSTPKG